MDTDAHTGEPESSTPRWLGTSQPLPGLSGVLGASFGLGCTPAGNPRGQGGRQHGGGPSGGLTVCSTNRAQRPAGDARCPQWNWAVKTLKRMSWVSLLPGGKPPMCSHHTGFCPKLRPCPAGFLWPCFAPTMLPWSTSRYSARAPSSCRWLSGLMRLLT